MIKGNYNLSRRYAFNWRGNRECSDVSRHSDPPIAVVGGL